jgi:hypothetical protein
MRVVLRYFSSIGRGQSQNTKRNPRRVVDYSFGAHYYLYSTSTKVDGYFLFFVLILLQDISVP